jgi:hypothetical protein
MCGPAPREKVLQSHLFWRVLASNKELHGAVFSGLPDSLKEKRSKYFVFSGKKCKGSGTAC